MRRVAVAMCIVGCGNDLPPPGSCDLATAGGQPAIELVELPGGPSPFDDLRYSPQLMRVVAAPPGTGVISLIDPDTLAIDNLDVPRGVESADASATTVFAVDRENEQLLAIELATGETATASIPGPPDYVRFVPVSNQLWVSIPATNRIEIYDATSLIAIGSVTLAGPPEGLTIVGQFAYANANGRVTAIDIGERRVVGEWQSGCGYSHGFPQVDEAYRLAFGGCFSNGGVGVVTMAGELVAGFEAGGGEAIVAYDPTRHRLYVRGDGSPTLSVIATCPNGQLGVLASVTVSNEGHAASADDRGHVWVADATTGGVFRVTDSLVVLP